MDISGFRRVAEAHEREKQRLAVYAPAKPAKPAPAPAKPAIDPVKTAAAIILAGRVRRGESPPEPPASGLARAIIRAGARARGERVEDDDDNTPDADDDDDQETPLVDGDEDDDNAKKAKDLARKIIEAGRKRRGD
jgi:hypothetical protein